MVGTVGEGVQVADGIGEAVNVGELVGVEVRVGVAVRVKVGVTVRVGVSVMVGVGLFGGVGVTRKAAERVSREVGLTRCKSTVGVGVTNCRGVTVGGGRVSSLTKRGLVSSGTVQAKRSKSPHIRIQTHRWLFMPDHKRGSMHL
jgi:hypothetical protein